MLFGGERKKKSSGSQKVTQMRSGARVTKHGNGKGRVTRTLS